ncbi:DUF4190 domain-containing protein [Neisseria shayeganii]|uniref:HesB/YadR/YfhF family protein n=1 Tax=Neisseria shayeganii 871 TaxID=1032488 RepID=G4CGD2_9NEIS|nr:DUF4190 domain-containing protein [Neisseria shayeganii]EGY53180.1 HesB/YadR/YfhF family protein [Neisseria shayeganii 871]
MPTSPYTNSTLATVSLVCGILGWTILPLVGSAAAVITGHMARKEIRLNPALQGDGLAVIGLVLGYSNLAVIMLAFIIIFLFFGGLAFLG